MDHSMYICPNCKKIFKVVGKNKTISCSSCAHSALIDMDTDYSEWIKYDKERKEQIKNIACTQSNNASTVPTVNMKKSSFFDTPNNIDSKIDNRDLSTDQSSANTDHKGTEVPVTTPNPLLINCPVCGKEISKNAISCPNCGNPMNAQPIIKAKKDYKKIAKRFTIIGLIEFFITGMVIMANTTTMIARKANYYLRGTGSYPFYAFLEELFCWIGIILIGIGIIYWIVYFINNKDSK